MSGKLLSNLLCPFFRVRVWVNKNVHPAHQSWAIVGFAFILGICIPCDKTFVNVSCYWPSDLGFEVWHTFKKNLTIVRTLKPDKNRVSLLHICISCYKCFHGYYNCYLVTLTLKFDVLWETLIFFSFLNPPPPMK